MKSLMKIYVKYIAAALTTILAFILLQLVILGVVTAKIYGSGNNYGKYSIAQAYDKLSAAETTRIRFRKSPRFPAGIWMIIRSRYGAGTRDFWWWDIPGEVSGITIFTRI